MSRALIASIVCLTVLQLAACGDDDDAVDGGRRDASIADLGRTDLAANDFGAPDLGMDDASAADSGTGDAAVASDAALADGAISDGAMDAAFDPASCVAQAAVAVGACDMVLGVTWNGAECVFLRGCSCAGTACGELFPNRDACLSAYATCVIARMCDDTTCSGAMECVDCPGGAQCLMADAGICVP